LAFNTHVKQDVPGIWIESGFNPDYNPNAMYIIVFVFIPLCRPGIWIESGFNPDYKLNAMYILVFVFTPYVD
jgi:hypothetical protein